jgi:hypothetical protein
MSKPWLSRILQIAGMLALIALTVIVYRRTDWCKGFTPDGVMTLIAGLIAFAAVIIQIRSSSGQLRDQIRAQRDAEREEQERQRRIVARALLFEIDGLYRWLLRDVRDFLRGVNAKTETLSGLEAKPVGASPFVVFDANAARVGELEEPLVENVVRFYMGARACLYAIERYDGARTRYMAGATTENEDLARQWLENVQKGIPPLILIAYKVSRDLCEALSIKFEAPRIAVAAENMDALRQEITKMGYGEIFEPEP